MPLSVLIEGVLFYKSAPMKRVTLRKLFDLDEVGLQSALEELRSALLGRGVRLLETETEVQLVTAPELAELIEALRKDDLKADIGKAGAETLAIIVYKSPVSRAEIDSIRGVNSAFILRALMTRGLVSRAKRGNSYDFSPTPELLAHLGVEKKEDLTDFTAIMNALEHFEVTQK